MLIPEHEWKDNNDYDAMIDLMGSLGDDDPPNGDGDDPVPVPVPAVNVVVDDDRQPDDILWLATAVATLRSSHNLSLNALDMVMSILTNYLKVAQLQPAHGHTVPDKYDKALSVAGLTNSGWQNHVYCSACNSISSIKVKVKSSGEPIKLACEYVQFPNSKKAKACGNILWKPSQKKRVLEKKKTGRGPARVVVPDAAVDMKVYGEVLNKKAAAPKVWIPKVVFPRLKLFSRLRELFQRTGFAADIEQWRTRNIPAGFMADVYDSAMWERLQSLTLPDGVTTVPLLSKKYQLALSLSVDWFGQFIHTKHSSAPLFLSIQNLPRRRRFLLTNIIMAGMLPGPREPKDASMLLRPLVEELHLLAVNGIDLLVETENKVQNINIRVVLYSINCDLPAKSKVTGHAGHGAMQGCSFCTQEFPHDANANKCLTSCDIERIPEGRNIEWPWRIIRYPSRTTQQHRADIAAWEAKPNQAQRNASKKATGAYRTAFTRLWYFDTIGQVALDTFHNLYLGTPKHYMELLVATDVIDRAAQQIIQKWLADIKLPKAYGRLPQKIATSDPKAAFSDLLGADWRMWTLYWSEPALHAAGLLTGKDKKEMLEPWLTYTRACRLIDSSYLSHDEIWEANHLFEQFHWEFQELFGEAACRPNIHAHLHVCQTILRLGPSKSTWVIAYERMNGHVGRIPTNNRQIEIQQLKRMLQTSKVATLSGELHQRNPDWPGAHLLLPNKKLAVADDEKEQEKARNYLDVDGGDAENLPGLGLRGDPKLVTFEKTMRDHLKQFYEAKGWYQDMYTWHVMESANSYKSFRLGEWEFKPARIKPESSYIVALFKDARTQNERDYVGQIVDIVQHEVTYSIEKGAEPKSATHTLAYVRWLKHKASPLQRPFYRCQGFAAPDATCWLPLKDITAHCGYMFDDATHVFNFVAFSLEIAY